MSLLGNLCVSLHQSLGVMADMSGIVKEKKGKHRDKHSLPILMYVMQSAAVKTAS